MIPMINVREILQTARELRLRALSEYDSKQVLSEYGIPTVNETLAQDWKGIEKAASTIGFPVVLKVCSPAVTHKTESGLIEVDLRTESELERSYQRMQKQAQDIDGEFLIQEMVKGSREFVMGMTRDAQFGPCVMFGLGGIFTEALNDVSFRVAPITERDAREMVEETKASKLLGPIRGMEAVDLKSLYRSLMALADLGLEYGDIQEIDVNPLIVKGSQPVAVDALVVLK
jgi:acetyl-CoA synthetase (ADP-forming)